MLINAYVIQPIKLIDNYGITEQCDPRQARFGRPCHVSQTFGGDAEPHRLEADCNVVRSMQADCGIHAPGISAVAGECRPD